MFWIRLHSNSVNILPLGPGFNVGASEFHHRRKDYQYSVALQFSRSKVMTQYLVIQPRDLDQSQHLECGRSAKRCIQDLERLCRSGDPCCWSKWQLVGYNSSNNSRWNFKNQRLDHSLSISDEILLFVEVVRRFWRLFQRA